MLKMMEFNSRRVENSHFRDHIMLHSSLVDTALKADGTRIATDVSTSAQYYGKESSAGRNRQFFLLNSSKKHRR